MSRNSMLSLFAACLLGSLSSCLLAAAGAGAAGAVYLDGEVKATLPASPQRVTEAATNVVKAKDLRLESSESSGVDGRVVAKSALDTTITITVKRQDEQSSRVFIRVGTFGDKDLSNELLEQIRGQLSLPDGAAALHTGGPATGSNPR